MEAQSASGRARARVRQHGTWLHARAGAAPRTAGATVVAGDERLRQTGPPRNIVLRAQAAQRARESLAVHRCRWSFAYCTCTACGRQRGLIPRRPSRLSSAVVDLHRRSCLYLAFSQLSLQPISLTSLCHSLSLSLSSLSLSSLSVCVSLSARAKMSNDGREHHVAKPSKLLEDGYNLPNLDCAYQTNS